MRRRLSNLFLLRVSRLLRLEKLSTGALDGGLIEKLIKPATV